MASYFGICSRTITRCIFRFQSALFRRANAIVISEVEFAASAAGRERYVYFRADDRDEDQSNRSLREVAGADRR